MNTDLVAIDACVHPEITVETSVMSSGYTVYCKTCRRKIIIPETTLIMDENSLIGIIGEVFGEEVARRIARYT